MLRNLVKTTAQWLFCCRLELVKKEYLDGSELAALNSAIRGLCNVAYQPIKKREPAKP